MLRRNDVPYAVTSVAEARKAVQDLAPHKPDFVKIWVDSRNGRQQKLTPEMFAAAADEARKQGLPSIAHVFDLADAKLLVRAGVEGFLHSIRDQEVDDEFIKLAKERNIWITPNLGGMNRLSLIRENGTPAWFDEPLVRETIPPAMIRERAQLYEKRKREGAPPRPVFDVINVRKLHAAGVRQVLGSDAAGDGNRWLGLQTLLEFDNMVAAGFTPMEMIVAATRDSAQVLRLDQLGQVAAGQERRLHRAGRQPARQHRQRPQDQRGLPQGRGRRPRGVAGEVAGPVAREGATLTTTCAQVRSRLRDVTGAGQSSCRNNPPYGRKPWKRG